MSARRPVHHASRHQRFDLAAAVIGGREEHPRGQPARPDGSATTVIPYGVGGNLHQAVPLDDGSVLVTSDGSNASRRFDPGTSTWTTSTMSGARGLSTMTVLADGRVLLAGGSNLNTAEIYNPDVNVWTAATPMLSVRRAAVAALLGDGSVLMVSGNSNAGEVNATERYVP